MVIDRTSSARDACHRCGGFMVPVEIREANVVGRRCVMCGDHVDPLILEHRRKMSETRELQRLQARAVAAATPLN
ncbi:MAG: hypothetical protein KF814_07520 [Nitrospiraceae bacterium]|nr:hypothetical protein [Nitrospiraceae bacterium]